MNMMRLVLVIFVIGNCCFAELSKGEFENRLSAIDKLKTIDSSKAISESAKLFDEIRRPKSDIVPITNGETHDYRVYYEEERIRLFKIIMTINNDGTKFVVRDILVSYFLRHPQEARFASCDPEFEQIATLAFDYFFKTPVVEFENLFEDIHKNSNYQPNYRINAKMVLLLIDIKKREITKTIDKFNFLCNSLNSPGRHGNWEFYYEKYVPYSENFNMAIDDEARIQLIMSEGPEVLPFLYEKIKSYDNSGQHNEWVLLKKYGIAHCINQIVKHYNVSNAKEYVDKDSEKWGKAYMENRKIFKEVLDNYLKEKKKNGDR